MTSNNECLWIFVGPHYATHQTDEGALGANLTERQP